MPVSAFPSPGCWTPGRVSAAPVCLGRIPHSAAYNLRVRNRPSVNILSGLLGSGEGGVQRRGVEGAQQFDKNLRGRPQGFVLVRVQIERRVAAATLVQR